MPSRAANIRDALVVALAVLVAGWVAPYFPYLGLPLAGAALGWLAYRFGYGWSIGVAVLGGALAALAGPLNVVFVLPAMLAVGPLCAWMMRRWKAQRAVLVLTVVIGVASLLPYGVVGLLTGKGMLAAIESDLAASLAAYGQVLARLSTNAAELGTLTEALKQTARLLWPSGVVYQALLAAFASVLAVGWAARRASVHVREFPRLALYDASIHWVWPTIAGLALAAGAAFASQPYGWMQGLGLNMLYLVRPVLVMQGIAVFASLLDRFKAGRTGRVIGLFGIVLLELMFPTVSVLGLADLFANFRRLDRPGVPPVAEKP